MGHDDDPVGLGNALFSGIRKGLLELFFGNPGRSYYKNELKRLVSRGGGLDREINNLSRVGLITSQKVGNQVHYRANRDAPIFEELCGIVRKTFVLALSETLRTALNPLGNSLHAAFVYGSIARGEDRAGSDIDLFVLSDSIGLRAVHAALEQSEDQLDRKVSPVIYTRAELYAKIAEKNSFVTRILELPKIPLIGDINDFVGKDGVTKPGEPGNEGSTSEGAPGQSGI